MRKVKKLITLLLIVGYSLFDAHAQAGYSKTDDDNSDIFISFHDNSDGGTINIYQNPAILVLLEKSISMNEKDGLSGYRIQVYSGTGVTAREKASSIKQELMQNFPEIDEDVIYTDYQEPYFKVNVGDFRNRNEAFELYYNIKNKFPGSYIVNSKINFPKLELSEGK